MMLDDFIANDEVKTELEQAMLSNKLPHAIIIEGAKGTGKKTIADIIAGYCVCQGEKRPCGTCPGCIKALHKSHPDIFIADGSNSVEINIEAIRNIRQDAYIMPNEARLKVYLLLDCDKMLIPSQNAFLKVLEEPPANVIFVITVTSANMLLQTVRSRSRIYTLYPVSNEQAAGYLLKKYPEKPYDEILRAASLCDGNIGKTAEILESGGEQSSKLANDIFSAIANGKEYDTLVLTSQMTTNRNFASSVLDFLLENAAECVKVSVGGSSDSEIAKRVAAAKSKNRILRLAENIDRAKEILSTNVNLSFFSTWLASVLKL